MVQKYSQLTKAHQLIKKQIKGTPEEIANLLGMSKVVCIEFLKN